MKPVSLLRTAATNTLRWLIPRRDREWLQAILTESGVVDSGRRWELVTASAHVAGHAVLRRLFAGRGYWVTGLLAGLLVAFMGLTLGSLWPHLVVLALSVGLLSFAASDWAWRWALLVALPKPVFVEAGWYGPYFYDRFDAYYAVLPALVIALAVSRLRGFLDRRLGAPPSA